MAEGCDLGNVMQQGQVVNVGNAWRTKHRSAVV